jgi:hypothetical protein
VCSILDRFSGCVTSADSRGRFCVGVLRGGEFGLAGKLCLIGSCGYRDSL